LNIHPVKKFAKTRITIAAFLIFLFTGEIGMFVDFLTGFIGNCEFLPAGRQEKLEIF